MTTPELAMIVAAPAAPTPGLPAEAQSALPAPQRGEPPVGAAAHTPVLLLDSLDDTTRMRLERALSPGGYVISGAVLTHPISQRLIIADRSGYRGLSADDMERIMAWKDPLESANRAAHRETQDRPVEVPASADLPDLRPAASVRPSLSTAPTRAMLDSVEAALAELARESGCIYNEDIAHNAGWFVPGKPTAFKSPYDAIRALIDHSNAGAPVSRPAAAPRKARATAANAVAMPADAETPACPAEEQAQGGLF